MNIFKRIYNALFVSSVDYIDPILDKLKPTYVDANDFLIWAFGEEHSVLTDEGKIDRWNSLHDTIFRLEVKILDKETLQSLYHAWIVHAKK